MKKRVETKTKFEANTRSEGPTHPSRIASSSHLIRSQSPPSFFCRGLGGGTAGRKQIVHHLHFADFSAHLADATTALQKEFDARTLPFESFVTWRNFVRICKDDPLLGDRPPSGEVTGGSDGFRRRGRPPTGGRPPIPPPSASAGSGLRQRTLDGVLGITGRKGADNMDLSTTDRGNCGSGGSWPGKAAVEGAGLSSTGSSTLLEKAIEPGANAAPDYSGDDECCIVEAVLGGDSTPCAPGAGGAERGRIDGVASSSSAVPASHRGRVLLGKRGIGDGREVGGGAGNQSCGGRDSSGIHSSKRQRPSDGEDGGKLQASSTKRKVRSLASCDVGEKDAINSCEGHGGSNVARSCGGSKQPSRTRISGMTSPCSAAPKASSSGAGGSSCMGHLAALPQKEGGGAASVSSVDVRGNNSSWGEVVDLSEDSPRQAPPLRAPMPRPESPSTWHQQRESRSEAGLGASGGGAEDDGVVLDVCSSDDDFSL